MRSVPRWSLVLLTHTQSFDLAGVEGLVGQTKT